MTICPKCGQDNPDEARFCNACAAPLAAAPAAEVRKTVTVLFCDLVGSTALGDRADPELLREAMSRYHRELRTILERHGGTVEKFVGDAAMAVFGLPQVHEDDALRAVRAAEEIRAAVAELGLEVRIGINTGEVVAGSGETLVTGDAVNVAARLEQSGEAGEILLGEGTERLVREAVLAEPVEPLALKGKAEPVPAFRLLEVLTDVPAFTRPLEAPFVGREHELEALEAAFAAAVEQRQPQLATVVGPPGIGKSRLARELIGGSQARVLVGRCLSYGEGITYWPLAEVVQQVGDLASVLDDELAVERIHAALVAGSATADEIAWAFRRLFETLAQDRPLIVVLDDIHWAEPTLLDLIDYVAAFAQDAPLLLLCMARPDLYELRPAWTNPKPNATLLTLEPLGEEHTETLVEELRHLPEHTKERIVQAAEGNPLFVEQLVAMQAEAGNGQLQIPPTIQALLAARIDRLEPQERAVIERASVEGRMFHRGAVQELLPRSERSGVGAQLMALVRKEFIRPDRSRLPGDDGFRFGHILICDAAYDSIPKRLRAELHERFAGWLEARMGGDAPDEILGYHLEHAHRYRTELGLDDEHTRQLALRAGRLLAAAGDRGDERGDAATTVRSLFAGATRLLPDDDPLQPWVLTQLGIANANAGDTSRALDLLRQAQARAAAANQRSVELIARAKELIVSGWAAAPLDPEAALSELERAISELESLGDARALTAAWGAVQALSELLGQGARKETAARNWLACAQEAGWAREAVWAAGHVVMALASGPTPAEEGIRQAERVQSAFAHEHPGDNGLALLYAFAARDGDAQQMIGRVRRMRLDRDQRTYYANSAMFVAWIALLGGYPEGAEPALREGAEILEASGSSGSFSTLAAVLGKVLYELGRFDEAEAWTRRAEQTGDPKDVITQAPWRSTRAKVLARRGEEEQALRLSAEAVSLAQKTDYLYFLGDCLADHAQVLRLLRRPNEAHPFLEEALAVYERKGIVPAIERTKQALAELDAADGAHPRPVSTG